MTDSNGDGNLHLEIGDLIFILSDEKQTVVPAIVSDELVHKHMGGTVTSWKVQIGPPSARSVVDTRRIKGTIYNDLSKVKEALLQRVSLFMDHLFSGVVKDSKDWYGMTVYPPSPRVGGGFEGVDPEETHEGPPEPTLDPDALLAGISRNAQASQATATNMTPLQTVPQAPPTVVLRDVGSGLTKEQVRAAMRAEIRGENE